MTTTQLSLVVPVKDEEDNLAPLYEEIAATLDRWRWELILVDDGSNDGSWEIVKRLAATDPRVRGLRLDANHGQTAAFLAGFEAAQASVIVTLDADLQNHPGDIPTLVSALADADMAIGCRVGRADSLVRRVSSRLANRVRARTLGDGISDIGCSLKAFGPEAVAAVPPFEGMHRFFPVLARMQGLKVVEIPVSHRPRAGGRSKYGIRNRALRTLVDLFAVRWMLKRRLAFRVAARTTTPVPVVETTFERAAT